MAITKLAELSPDPTTKIILAKMQDIPDWMVPALNELVKREAPLSIDEAVRLESVVGLDFILKIAHARELSAHSTCRRDDHWCRACSKFACDCDNSSRAKKDFADVVRRVFSL